MVAAVAIDQDDRNLRLFHLLVKFVRIHTDYNDSIQIPLLGQRQIAFICVRCRNQNMIAAQTCVIFNAAENFTVKTVLEHQTLAGLRLWNNDANEFGIPHRQAACIQIRYIIQFFDCLHDAGFCFFRDRAFPIQDIGYCSR